MAESQSSLSDTFQRAIGDGRVDQLGFLVEDLRVSMATWSALYPKEEWRIYTYDSSNVSGLTYRGGPGQFKMRLALISLSPQIELIQPLQGPSIYHDWIDRHGFGLHHLGFFVPSVATAITALTDGGYPAIQTGMGYGLDGDGGFAYFDFEDTYGLHLETIEVPVRRRPGETL